MKVFWSWQSDTPGKIGRHFVRAALEAAIQELKEPPEIEEPVRAEVREKLHLDSDRQGIPGSPDLVKAITDKIDAASVFVADVTAVGFVPDEKGQPQKKLINSNVAIELGYALKALNTEHVLMVCNSAFGGRDDIPFDLAHKGGPIWFDLPKDADSATVKARANELRTDLVKALRPYVEEAAKSSSEPDHAGTPFTFSRAAYFQPGEVLATIGSQENDELIEYSYDLGALAYLRLLPTRANERVRSTELQQAAMNVPFLNGNSFSATSHRNKYGVLRYSPGSHPRNGPAAIVCSTQLFPSGEVWMVNANRVISERTSAMRDWPLPLIPMGSFEVAFRQALTDVLPFAAKYLHQSPPWRVEIGICGAEGAYLGVTDWWQGLPGPIHQADIFIEANLNSADTSATDRVLLDFFEMIFEAAGVDRPANFNNWPTRQSGG